MFRPTTTNILRLLTPSNSRYTAFQLRNSTPFFSALINSPQHTTISPQLIKPLSSISLLQQRFASQKTSTSSKASPSTNAQTVNSKKVSEVKKEKADPTPVKAKAQPQKEATVEEQEEAEDDILYKSIEIEARSIDRAVLDSYEKYISMTANYLDIKVTRVWEPYRTIVRRTLLRSAFVKKKYLVQYEWRTYYRSMSFQHLTGSTANTFLEYIQRNLPEGVALKVTRKQLEVMPSHLVPPVASTPRARTPDQPSAQ